MRKSVLYGQITCGHNQTRRNFWILKKVAKMTKFLLRPHFIILVENANFFFRNYHNRWLEVEWRVNLISFKCLGRTFQPSRNITPYRSSLQVDVKWLFLPILWLPEVWHEILCKTALFNIMNFSTKGEFLVNIHCWLSWEHILSSSFVGIGRRFSNVHNF